LIETNTFNAHVSLAEYGMQELIYELNVQATRLARAGQRRGSHNRSAPVRGRTASISSNVNDPGARNVSYAVIPYHAIPAGMDMGIVTPALWCSLTRSTSGCESGSRTSSSTAARRDRAATRDCDRVSRRRYQGRGRYREWRFLQPERARADATGVARR